MQEARHPVWATPSTAIQAPRGHDDAALRRALSPDGRGVPVRSRRHLRDHRLRTHSGQPLWWSPSRRHSRGCASRARQTQGRHDPQRHRHDLNPHLDHLPGTPAVARYDAVTAVQVRSHSERVSWTLPRCRRAASSRALPAGNLSTIPVERYRNRQPGSAGHRATQRSRRSWLAVVIHSSMWSRVQP